MGLEYGGDALKIFTVFLQISSASPGILQLPFPQVYKDFLQAFAWVNFDVLGLLGLECVGTSLLDYRARVALVCLLPVIIVGGSAMMYLVRKQATKRALGTATDAERKHAISKLFDFVDADSSAPASSIRKSLK